jgi:hypothetical protein
MNSDQTFRRRSNIVALIVTLVVIVLAGLLAGPLVQAITGESIGTHLAEQKGDIIIDRYRSVREAPASDVPKWLPHTATDLVIAKPASASGLDEQVRIEATVPASTLPPTTCRPAAGFSMPFVVPENWPAFTAKDLRTCDDLVLAVHSGKWYAWGQLR